MRALKFPETPGSLDAKSFLAYPVQPRAGGLLLMPMCGGIITLYGQVGFQAAQSPGWGFTIFFSFLTFYFTLGEPHPALPSF